MSNSAESSEIFLRAANVMERYSVSDMWLHRRLKDGSGFPTPIYIGKQRYWRLSELVAWERACARKSAAPEQHVAA